MSAEYGLDATRLFDGNGQRRYLTHGEVRRLLAVANRGDRQTRLFCRLLFYTGCRISEGLALTPRRLDAETQRVVFRTLKRRKTVFRAVPVPPYLIKELVALSCNLAPDDRLFPWSRQTGWRRIKGLMVEAGVVGPQATAKGLRHQFGIRGIERQLPESAVGRFLGHASVKSTQIYTHAVGAEERVLASRMW